MTARTDRIDELFRQEITAILSREVDDPKIGFATITGIETQPDLRHAKVTVSVIGPPEQRRATIVAMGKAMPFVRHELGRRLRIRRIPDLHVHLDDTAERGTRILQLLAEIETGNVSDPDAPIAESLPTPVPRLGQPDDLPEEPPSAVRPPVPPRPRARRSSARPTSPRKPARSRKGQP